MKADNDLFLDIKKRSFQELLDLALDENDVDKYWTIVAEVHSCGCQDVFDSIKEYSQSNYSTERMLAADVLGQLRNGKCKLFHDESVMILLHLLKDVDDKVVASAAFSLGHRHDVRAINPLLLLINHENSWVREDVVTGLSNHEDTNAINGLIQLSRDSDFNVQNWAVFGLASLCKKDSEKIRSALFTQLQNSDDEIRGEAMIGLARRKDGRVKNSIVKELNNSKDGYWVLDAVIEMPDKEYINPLKELIQSMIEKKEFERHIEDANNALHLCLNL